MNEDSPQQNKAYLRRPVRQFQQPEEEKKDHIKTWIGLSMIIFAFCVDLIEMFLEWLGIGVLGFSSLLSIYTSVTFYIWFKLHEVNFMGSPKKLGTSLVTSILEIVTGLDAIGGFIWTIGTILMVIIVKAEDKGGALGKVAGAAQNKLTH